MIFWVLLGFCACVVQISGQAHYLKFHQLPSPDFACTILEDDFTPYYRGFNEKENGLRYFIKPAEKHLQGTPINAKLSDAKIVEVFGRNHNEVLAFAQTMCTSFEKVTPLVLTNTKADPEIRKIVDGGDQKNRIDVVFMGDGYIATEREEFFEDIERLTQEMFAGVTFRSYLPLFNIWAVYVESQESGIGYDGAKNTAFRLYRQRGQLRAILPGNSSHARQVCALTGTSGCDYPSIIGNDDFYGGLGGEFVISTRSNRTGTVVLRHEMGHNFADVGEEYDDGSVYSGVNSARSVASLGWSAWLSGERREERAIFRLLEYPWADLSQGSKSYTFTSDGNYARWYLEVTVSAAGEYDSLEFLLDGEVLPWKTSGFDDREFYGWHGEEGFASGRHNFSVRSKTASTHPDIPRMICSITLHEYGSEEEFKWAPDHVSAYPTWSSSGTKTFRPTNEGCLMRNMTHNRLCPVCQEGMWQEFLQRISLIDDVVVSDTSSNGTRVVSVETLKLGQLRAPGNEVVGEKLEIKWFKNNQEQNDFQDQFSIEASPGNWAVQVHLDSPEIRNDPNNLSTSTQNFVVSP